MVSRAGLPNEDMEFVQFHPTGTFLDVTRSRRQFLFLILSKSNPLQPGIAFYIP